MKLVELTLCHFRNIHQKKIEFGPGITWLAGQNGSGKTSILEAIYYLVYGRSFRASSFKQVIQRGADQFTVAAKWLEDTGNCTLIGLQKKADGATLLKKNKETVSSHADIAESLPVMIIGPELVSQLTQESLHRRQLIDWGVFYYFPQFKGYWKQYRKLLAQRNALLKQGKCTQQTLAYWDQALSEAGEKIGQLRQDYIEKLEEQVNALLPTFLKDHHITLQYFSGWSRGKSLQESLIEQRVSDLQHGFTHAGPHRADYRFRVNNTNMKNILSRGQQKRLLYGVKVAQSHLLKQPGLVLVDDFAAELDEQYQAILFKWLEDSPHQAILSTLSLSQSVYPFIRL